VAYQALSTGQNNAMISVKENGIDKDKEAKKISDKRDVKTATEATENSLVAKASGTAKEPENNRINMAENMFNQEQSERQYTADKKSLSKASSAPGIKSSGFTTYQSSRRKGTEKQKELTEEIPEQALAVIAKNEEIKDIEKSRINTEEENNPGIAVTKNETSDRFASPDYLNAHEGNLANAIPLNTRIIYEAAYQIEESKESFFKAPSEAYVSFTPSLSYYRVFSSIPINQFNGADNGGRLGWAVQAGVVYPLKLRRFSYRVGVGYFSAQSNFRYNLLNGRQQPIRLNNNTFEYGNIESPQSESKKWQVLEIQNDLMYKVRPMQEFILGFKAGGNVGQKPVFDAYTGYRFSKSISHRQTLWVEIAYTYALNAQQSSRNTFSYHMDKYSLRVGLNYR
jgi:hypothetical protein